jgi:hypothetical protein
MQQESLQEPKLNIQSTNIFTEFFWEMPQKFCFFIHKSIVYFIMLFYTVRSESRRDLGYGT